MILTTIKDLLQGRFAHVEEDGTPRRCSMGEDPGGELLLNHRIYLFYDQFQDQQIAFYVGQSKSILDRIGGYIGWNSYCEASAIRLFIHANLPQSYGWAIALYSLDDCLGLYRKHRQGIMEGFVKHFKAQGKSFNPPTFKPSSFTVNNAEEFFIRRYSPCLNIAFNPSPTKIPTAYRLPASSIPDGIICSPRKSPLTPYTVTYHAYDFETQQNREYSVTMHACYKKDCYQMVLRLLGYKPDQSIRIAESYQPLEVSYSADMQSF